MRNLPHRFVALVSRMAPSSRRREFRAEWEAELATDPTMTRAVGAVSDAWFLGRQAWRGAQRGGSGDGADRVLRARPPRRANGSAGGAKRNVKCSMFNVQCSERSDLRRWALSIH